LIIDRVRRQETTHCQPLKLVTNKEGISVRARKLSLVVAAMAALTVAVAPGVSATPMLAE
jgi:hypothetical protein